MEQPKLKPLVSMTKAVTGVPLVPGNAAKQYGSFSLRPDGVYIRKRGRQGTTEQKVC